MEELVVALRLTHPTKGAHVLARMLQDRGCAGGACQGTILPFSDDMGSSMNPRLAKHTPYVRFERAEANELWQMESRDDIAVQHHRCHPFTLSWTIIPASTWRCKPVPTSRETRSKTASPTFFGVTACLRPC